MRERVRINFSGHLNPVSFAEFVAHRAGRLNLSAALQSADNVQADVEVSGDSGLIDAFEVACSLGPIDCIVLDYQRHPSDRKVVS